ncbi:MerR family transcriptional regulator [Oceanobacillus luteolus]|uniref:MerR family transcriptional regulator n=1 Tax=Oceanobacillus luteolus TaxID=1274358 RepID=A0ABW4HWN9_9BACI|nr:MerR family transcriptional regulator [Oceanobacillus luteolus]MCM3741584.1 MerR family transcriptional regulator [Oceanobacillus luteolus]
MYLVGQLSKITDVSVRTLHYYDEIGLLTPSKKSDTGYRYYTKDDLIKLQQIIVLKKLGFKLSQIKPMILENTKTTKVETWKQVFEMEIGKIQEEKQRLDALEQSLHGVLHALELTGDVSTQFILDIIQSVQSDHIDSFLHRNFTEEEQTILIKQMPNLTTHDEKTKKWMNLLKKVHQTKREPVDSKPSQELAKEMMEFIQQELQIDDAIIDKYWEKIKPENSGQSEKVLGLDKETMEYIEQILDRYEQNGKEAEGRGEAN